MARWRFVRTTLNSGSTALPFSRRISPSRPSSPEWRYDATSSLPKASGAARRHGGRACSGCSLDMTRSARHLRPASSTESAISFPGKFQMAEPVRSQFNLKASSVKSRFRRTSAVATLLFYGRPVCAAPCCRFHARLPALIVASFSAGRIEETPPRWFHRSKPDDETVARFNGSLSAAVARSSLARACSSASSTALATRTRVRGTCSW